MPGAAGNTGSACRGAGGGGGVPKSGTVGAPGVRSVRFGVTVGGGNGVTAGGAADGSGVTAGGTAAGRLLAGGVTGGTAAALGAGTAGSIGSAGPDGTGEGTGCTFAGGSAPLAGNTPGVTAGTGGDSTLGSRRPDGGRCPAGFSGTFQFGPLGAVGADGCDGVVFGIGGSSNLGGAGGAGTCWPVGLTVGIAAGAEGIFGDCESEPGAAGPVAGLGEGISGTSKPAGGAAGSFMGCDPEPGAAGSVAGLGGTDGNSKAGAGGFDGPPVGMVGAAGPYGDWYPPTGVTGPVPVGEMGGAEVPGRSNPAGMGGMMVGEGRSPLGARFVGVSTTFGAVGAGLVTVGTGFWVSGRGAVVSGWLVLDAVWPVGSLLAGNRSRTAPMPAARLSTTDATVRCRLLIPARNPDVVPGTGAGAGARGTVVAGGTGGGVVAATGLGAGAAAVAGFGGSGRAGGSTRGADPGSTGRGAGTGRGVERANAGLAGTSSAMGSVIRDPLDISIGDRETVTDRSRQSPFVNRQFGWLPATWRCVREGCGPFLPVRLPPASC